MDVSNLLKSLVIGIAIAAPVGPIGILCIRRTLAFGRLIGFVTGLGAATADATFAAIAALGLTAISQWLVQGQGWFRLIGGGFLLILGISTFLARPINSMKTDSSDFVPSRGLWGAYFSTFLLTLTNPLTIISFGAIFASIGFGAQENQGIQGLILVLGVFCGSTLWWFILSYISNVFRVRLLTPGGLVWVNRVSGLILIGFGVLAMAAGFKTFESTRQIEARMVTAASPEDNSGFTRADGSKQLVFPDDHGPHLDYQTEWWYYTGNLETNEGRHFGYQLTFFRRALLPPALVPERMSDWASGQAYMAHFAVTDVSGDDHQAYEKLSRGAVGLAGAQADPFSVWLDDWRVEEIAPNTYRLHATQLDSQDETVKVAVSLVLNDLKGPILQGDQGFSQKGAEDGQASYYYSLPRMKTEGELVLGKNTYKVDGFSWMDHEFSTSALSFNQVGWDWFSLQLDDNTELMVFQLRHADGSIDPYSSGTSIEPDSNTHPLTGEEFKIQVDGNWISHETGASYPSGWQVQVPSEKLELTIQPLVKNQELNLSFTYWEGAVKIRGYRNGKPIAGYGYVELTGYAGSMGGKF